MKYDYRYIGNLSNNIINLKHSSLVILYNIDCKILKFNIWNIIRLYVLIIKFDFLLNCIFYLYFVQIYNNLIMNSCVYVVIAGTAE